MRSDFNKVVVNSNGTQGWVQSSWIWSSGLPDYEDSGDDVVPYNGSEKVSRGSGRKLTMEVGGVSFP